MRTTNCHNRNPYYRASSARSIFFTLAFGAGLLPVYSQTGQRSDYSEKIESPNQNVNTDTFQEIGFFGEVKKEQWNAFVQAVQNNISQSRKEKGNLSFSLYQPEDGKRQPLWFERFKSKEDHSLHKQQAYFKHAISVIQQSLIGEAKSIPLNVVDELPVMIPAGAKHAGTSRYVIVLFDVRPEKRNAFIDAMTRATPRCRSARGNLEFNCYTYAEDPNKFVLIEGWQSRTDFEVQAKLDRTKKLSADLEDFLVNKPTDSRWVLMDISQ